MYFDGLLQHRSVTLSDHVVKTVFCMTNFAFSTFSCFDWHLVTWEEPVCLIWIFHTSPNIGHPSITTYHTRNRALYHTDYSSSRSTVSCPAERDLTCRRGEKETLEKDALSCNEAQLLEAVLETSTLKAAGREGWLSGDVSGQGLQWPKNHHVTTVWSGPNIVS